VAGARAAATLPLAALRRCRTVSFAARSAAQQQQQNRRIAVNFLDSYAPQIKALLRIVTGLLFLSFGVAKLLHFPAVPMFANVKPTDFPEGVTGWIELIGGALVLAGFFSRIAAFICSGEMAVAYFMVHLQQGPYPVLNGGALAILFCFVFLYFAAAGPGVWAVNQK
jgi:putative oxidoreductase